MRRTRQPTLTLVYLPHLDYGLQRLGPDHPDLASDLREIDEVVGELLEDAAKDGTRVVLLSEYGITAVRTPVHINRALRQAGLLGVRVEEGGELLDPPQSRAFAVADHQIAHIYVDRAELVPEVKRLVEGLEGVERVLDAEGKRRLGLDHERAGELVAIARPTPGSPTTTGWMTRALRTSRGWSRSTASRATTRSSCSSIPPSASPSWRWAGGWRSVAQGSARSWT